MIKIENLCKTFQRKGRDGKIVEKKAVDGLSLEIEKGEVFGLLGPNGAGKTTTIRMLTMLTSLTKGSVRYDGKELALHEQEIKQMIGVVPQHINFDLDLTVWENMELHGRLQHMPKKERHDRIEELLAYVELEERRNDTIRSLSGGMKRRLLIVRALMHRPKILFLDEPTVALDPQVRRRIWSIIHNLAKEGVTVVLTTHYIEEAQALCHRVAILNQGKLIELGTPHELCQAMGAYVVSWDGEKEQEYRFFPNREEASRFAGTLESSTIIRKSNLEDVFVELTGRTMG